MKKSETTKQVKQEKQENLVDNVDTAIDSSNDNGADMLSAMPMHKKLQFGPSSRQKHAETLRPPPRNVMGSPTDKILSPASKQLQQGNFFKARPLKFEPTKKKQQLHQRNNLSHQSQLDFEE